LITRGQGEGVVRDVEPREKTKRWISTLISISVILIPLIFLFAFTSPASTTNNSQLNSGYTTDAQVIFNTFVGLAVILFLMLLPVFVIMYRRERKNILR
jgi:nitrate reductase gamma subunit